jgi:ATP-dependent Clp protease adaptor protein ClpS
MQAAEELTLKELMAIKEQYQENTSVLTAESPTYSIILWNDDVNTFDWVIQTLVEICDMNESQAEQCSLIVHFKGKCVVAEGEYEDLKPKCSAITDRGIQATIEQLANQ